MPHLRFTGVIWLCLAALGALAAAPATRHAAGKPLQAGGVAATPAESPQAITSVNFKDLTEFCADLGYKPIEDKDNDGDRSLVLAMGDTKVGLLLYSDEDRIVSLTAQAHFRMNDTASISVANDWNVRQRYSRAYVQGTRFTLENDLNLQGGVTWRTIDLWLHTYATSLTRFTKHISF